MADLDFNLLEPSEEDRSFDPLPEGWYKASVLETERSTSQAGNDMLNVTFEITQADHAGRRAWNNFNLWHPAENVIGIAQRQFSDMARACGLTNCKDSDELIGLHLDIMLKVEQGNGQYGPKNRVVGYRTAPTTSTPTAVNKVAVAGNADDLPWTD